MFVRLFRPNIENGKFHYFNNQKNTFAMKIKNFLLVVLLGMTIISCKNEATVANDDKAEKVEATEVESVYDGYSVDNIDLDNGEKWAVNEEMKPFVEKGAELVKLTLEKDEIDGRNLAQELKSLNDQLIKSCTMTGQSHEELHKWLHPHLELVKKLENNEEPAKVEVLVHNLNKSYLTYNRFFK